MKVGFVKYSRGAGHTEDYIWLYGLIGVESSLYLADNYGFHDDTRLVEATLRSVEFPSESDRITSEGVNYESRNDLFSLVEDYYRLSKGNIGTDTDGVVLVY